MPPADDLEAAVEFVARGSQAYACNLAQLAVETASRSPYSRTASIGYVIRSRHASESSLVGSYLLASHASARPRTSSLQPRIIAVTFAISGLVALPGSRGRHLAWIAFFLVAVLTWLSEF